MLKSLIWGSNAPESEGDVDCEECVVNCNSSFFKFPVCGQTFYHCSQVASARMICVRDHLVTRDPRVECVFPRLTRCEDKPSHASIQVACSRLHELRVRGSYDVYESVPGRIYFTQ